MRNLICTIFVIFICLLTLNSYAQINFNTDIHKKCDENLLFAENTQELQKKDEAHQINIDAKNLKKMLREKDFLLINVHIPYEGEIEGTDLFIPYNEIEKNLDKLPANRSVKIVIYCRTERMSNIAAGILVKLGYTNIWNLKGGMAGWKEAGYSLIHKSR